jgi:putative membrane protein
VYEWVKAFHVIAVMAWMAGLLYLPRLFVYHCAAERGSKQSETFKVMERRLLKIIINPAMIATWVLGGWLVWRGGLIGARWLEAKLVLAVGLSVLHGLFVKWVKEFSADRNQRSPRFYRAVNEIPSLLMAAMVILAVVKPF